MNPGRHLPWMLALLVALPSPGLSQRLGALYSLSSSSHPELESPQGFVAFARMPIGSGWEFKVSFSRVEESNSKIGRVCRSYVPHIGCVYETTHTSLSLSSLRLAGYRPFPLNDQVAFNVGGGGSFNLLGGGSKGESGLRADLLVPKGGQIGAFVAFNVVVIPLRSFPVALEGGLNLHWINFAACSGGDPPQYDPFCESDDFQEIQIGLSVPFR